MGMLKEGDIVKLKFGGEVKILDQLGSGGQGTVYKVMHNNKEYALKWYHPGVFRNKAKEFYKNLESNIEKKAPNDAFLWPLYITEEIDGTFGYLMEMRPSGYYELTEFFTNSKNHPQKHFKSFTAQVDAVINIIQGFRELHNNGYSYQDLNNGNFFINPNNGDVLICDNDNVSPAGINLGIIGKRRYMAPEIVRGEKMPDKISDRFSLSVILFRMLFLNHPLEGQYSTPPCMTNDLEKKHYGEDPIFVFDQNDKRNRPIPGTDKNLRTFWPIYPQFIRDIFIRAFSKEVMLLKEQRIIEQEWLNAFIKLKSEIIICPHCKEETFIDSIGENSCIECHKKINVLAALNIRGQELPLYSTSKIMLWSIDNTLDDVKMQIGKVVENPNDKNIIGIANLSNYIFKVKLLDGSQRTVDKNKVVPIVKGYEIDFINNQNYKGIII